MANAVQFHRPTSINVDDVRAMSLRDLVLAVNTSRNIDHGYDHPLGNHTAVRNFVRGQAGALAQLCNQHANNTFATQPMFSHEAPADWLRPTFGLRRTFSPFVVRDDVVP
ncbi:small capsid protein [pteropodid alphaherpesvirus 2]|uniref:Small capsomere-interacting protein n=1 Tax=pteropodid alphaherpesvirus 2 TaxID=3118716 RepID=A0A510J6U8_9ALPH|nr:small capsid protein [pteropodid alphaherpesvirus 2]BBM13207.1 small capsid protein [pteropodid alphaherpesvirus 2]